MHALYNVIRTNELSSSTGTPVSPAEPPRRGEAHHIQTQKHIGELRPLHERVELTIARKKKRKKNEDRNEISQSTHTLQTRTPSPPQHQRALTSSCAGYLSPSTRACGSSARSIPPCRRAPPRYEEAAKNAVNNERERKAARRR